MTVKVLFSFLSGISLVLLSTLCARGQRSDPSMGQTLFVQHCSRCHGIQGKGGEGPALNRSVLPHASDDDAFADVIQNGIPGTSMPGIWSLGKKDISGIIAFVRGLGSREPLGNNLKGDIVAGEKLVAETGCLGCHMMGGKGTSLGPDLTSIGLRRGRNYLEEALNNPGRQKILDENGFIQYLVVEVTLHNGRSLTGIRFNEDTFTLQLKDTSNKFHSIRKQEIKTIHRRMEASLMPSYATTLSDDEKDNIIAFLMNP